MKHFHSFSLLLAALLLGGCAELSQLTGGGSEVPIDERGAVATGAASGPAAGAQAGTLTTGPAGESGIVETHALPPPGSSETMSVADVGNSGRSGTPAIVGASPQQAAMLRDPANPLSKRVVYFDYDSDAIREEYRGLIEAHAGFLKNNGAARIILQGHTDERGSRDYNLALGQRRSESVRQALNLMGVPADQVETVSLGEEKPVQEGHDEAAWKLNRRAEIIYLGE